MSYEHVSLNMDGSVGLGVNMGPRVLSRCELCGDNGVPDDHNSKLGYENLRPGGNVLVRQKCEKWSSSGDHRVHYVCRPCMSAYNIGRVKNPTKRRCPHEFDDADHTVASMRSKS